MSDETLEYLSGCLLLNVIISLSIRQNGLEDWNFSSLISHYNVAFFPQSRLEFTFPTVVMEFQVSVELLGSYSAYSH